MALTDEKASVYIRILYYLYTVYMYNEEVYAFLNLATIAATITTFY